MYLLNRHQLTKIEETTFTELGMKENDIEEIIRNNVDMLCDDEEAMLVVGQQVKNNLNAISDLTAIDNNGDIVLIEIKRDKKDIENRKEAFEFQAIRYAASCATIKSTDELIQNVFAPYVEKHKNEFVQFSSLTSPEIAKRLLTDFLTKNDVSSFNEHQRIILVASEFDKQTLSAVAWLNSNQVDITCYQICPYSLSKTILVDMKKILPVVEYDDFYVQVSKDVLHKNKKKDITRRSLPKIDAMLQWGIVSEGDIIIAKGTTEEAELMANGQVKTSNGAISMQQWLKSVFGWSAVQTYAFAVQKSSGKTLMDLRDWYISQNENIK